MSDEVDNKAPEQGMEQHFFRASAGEFNKIPGSPIAYWIDSGFLNIFRKATPIDDIAL